MALNILAEDATLLVVDKQAGMTVWPEGVRPGKTLADELLVAYPKLKALGEERRYGIVHRLDKDTSGILLVSKTKKAFDFLQKQFQERNVEKKYLCLVEGEVKKEKGKIETPLGRSPNDRRKQKAYSTEERGEAGVREAVTEYRVIKRFKDYTLLEAAPRTGRKHQLRAHFASLGHPIAGDKLYGFKNQQIPEGLQRQFLHASFLEVPAPDGTRRGFTSELPKDLKNILTHLESYANTN
ncbi:RluA family pseudouridine synthase [Patescibacteria group bacterium]|nr:RluA family pseudouridine synthase [Patescibacteria group bacterium]